MLFDGSYPPGVTGRMIDDLFDPVEPPEDCEHCRFYEERTCGMICSLLEADYTADDIVSMNDDEYMRLFGKEPDDRCDDFDVWED